MDSRVETTTLDTQYGKMEIEIVECASCNNEILFDLAEEFTIGDNKGWACEFCKGGPVDFPSDDDSEEAPSLLLGLVSLISATSMAFAFLAVLLYPFDLTLLTGTQAFSVFMFGLILAILLATFSDRWDMKYD